ncbi:hypothetical protein P6144_14850 [Sphingomonas sp. HITSZ_GF]|uniref:hypothetical protein n=1 Tax=Sphingomonas sp. HITSZ_GF TaxID=3037247 RepID=UPI00240CFCF2|nr:hypothetical protein [Sphingomonas sp. HITSZ_GF]MDG2534937.1 hypothetical protein [Sphingomonas sp. HITSZ_GF]
MRPVKLILSLLPLVYIGWLLIHFTSFDGWSDGMIAGGLGPTVLGLSAIGLLLALPLLLKLLRFLLTPSIPGESKPNAAAEGPAFDADAALARYLERKAAGQGSAEISEAEDAPRPVFGRKIVRE